jgi:hypothetical protein
LKVGTARFCISPTKEFYLIGYRSKNREYPAKGIHDDIYCNSLLFECNGKTVFLFSADFIEFEEEMAEDVKTLLQDKYGIERDLVLLSATHNHSSIVSYHRSWYTGKFDQEYYDFIIQTIIDSYKICQENMVEATAKYGKEVILGYYGNRNHPGQPADNEVIVVKFYDENNTPFAGIVNWAVHSTVISAENDQLTSELAGEVSKKLFDEFGFYPAMVVGAAGDCSNRNERQGNDFAELERVSTALARRIAMIETHLDIELGDIRYQSLYHTVHHDLFHLDAKFQVINIGKLQLFVFPGELGSKFGIKLKGTCSTLGLVLGYTNGYYQYFMPEEEYGLSFETITSPIPKGEPEKLINKFIQASNYLNNCK